MRQPEPDELALGLTPTPSEEIAEDGTDHGVVWAPAADPEGEGLVDEFVDFFNARDLDGIAGLLAEDIQAELVHVNGSVAAVIEGIEDLFMREPSVVLTRGELGNEPVAAVWHPAGDRYVAVGLLAFTFTEGEVEAIERIDLIDVLDQEDLLLEEPDGSELAEWEVAEDDWETRPGEHL